MAMAWALVILAMALLLDKLRLDASAQEETASISSCIGTWPYGNTLDAGETAEFKVDLYDSSGLAVSNFVNFVITASNPANLGGLTTKMDGVTEVITFTPNITGEFNLSITSGTETLPGSPFSFRVVAGWSAIAQAMSPY